MFIRLQAKAKLFNWKDNFTNLLNTDGKSRKREKLVEEEQQLSSKLCLWTSYFTFVARDEGEKRVTMKVENSSSHDSKGVFAKTSHVKFKGFATRMSCPWCCRLTTFHRTPYACLPRWRYKNNFPADQILKKNPFLFPSFIFSDECEKKNLKKSLLRN